MITFENIAPELEKIIKETTYGLYTNKEILTDKNGIPYEVEARKINSNYDYKFYYNSGDLIDVYNDLPVNTIAINFIDDGQVQDSSSPVRVALNSIILEFIGLEEYREDVNTIFREICYEYKSKLDKINGSPIQYTIDEFAAFSDREYEGRQYFTGDMSIDIIVWDTIVMSNSIKLYIGEEVNEDNEIQYSQMSSAREVQPYGDLRKLSEVPFAGETSTFKIGIKGIYANKSILNKIRTDHYTNSNFGSSYKVIIVDTTTNEQFTKIMLLTNSNFHYSFGQNCSYELAFTTYGDLTV